MEKRKGDRAPAGELQRQVMEVLWQREECTVRDVHERLLEQRPIAYTTVMTVMGRLADQGMLEREMRGKTGVYRASTTRDEAMAANLVDELMTKYGALGLAKFVERSRDAHMLEQLQQLVTEQSAEGSTDA